MTPEEWKRIDELFHAALERDSGERAAWLDAACAGDSRVRAEVARLLAAHTSAGDFIEPPTRPAASTDTPPAATAPERIGAYRLTRVIGSGGMGTVYEAVQDKPRRTVALKLLSRALASPSVLRRFEHESQILAHLRHPGIAQVYEAGVHREGAQTLPYFVMEFIDGVSLTRFAAEHALPVRQRLELLAKVCDAVQHGHQKGVIHRDLKPANILVDAGGQPKIIDFGVARVTDADLQVTTLQTDVGQLVGTLPYMSPEQMAGDPAELDTRSDVYALGVVAYELLTGRLPHELARKSVAEAARVVRDEEPTPIRSVNVVFRGDVDTILTKALERDKSRRYQSAHALATDIRRFLCDEPIAARPASTFYHLRKFSRRNRALVLGAVIAVAGLIGGTAFATWKALEATGERNRAQAAEQHVREQADATRIAARRAQRINRFLQDMLAAADPQQARGQDVSVRAMLDQAAERIDVELAEEPEVAAALHHTIGSTYRSLGLYALAEPQLQGALDLYRAHAGERAAETLETMHTLAVLQRDLGRTAAAEDLCRQMVERAEGTLGGEDSVTLGGLNLLALLLQDQGRLAEAEPHLRHVLAVQRRVSDPEDARTLLALNNLAWLLSMQGELPEACELFAETLAVRRRVSGDDHPETLRTMVNLADGLRRLGAFERAAPLSVEAVDGCRRVLGTGHGLTLYALDRLAWLYYEMGRTRDAETLARETLALRRAALGPEHPHTFYSMQTLVVVLTELGYFEEALELARATVAGRRELLGPEHPDTLASLNSLALALGQGGRVHEGVELLRGLVETHQRLDGANHIDTLGVTQNLALLLERLGEAPEAEALFERVRAAQARLSGPQHAATLACAAGVARAKLVQGRAAEAEGVLREIVAAAGDALPADHIVVVEARRDLGRCLAALERWDEAEAELLAAHAVLAARYGPMDWRVQTTARYLVDLYTAWGRPQLAEPYVRMLARDGDGSAAGRDSKTQACEAPVP